MIEDKLYAARSILVVGAHAFDAEVIAGPLAAAAVKGGAKVTFLHLSMGEQGHPCLIPEHYSGQKEDEAAKAAARLGVDMRNMKLRDAFLPNDNATALQVCDIIRELRPEAVITHWHGSWHKDHRAAAHLTQTGIFFSALPTLKRAQPAHTPQLLLFGENWEDDEGFRPEHLVDVSVGFDAWHEAVMEYELARGLSSFPYVDYYSALYRLRGCLRGTRHAQAFAAASHSWNAGSGLFAPPVDRSRET
ncbi:MAG: LmbE-like protein [Mesorhizobium sp.]|uniref:PIG-L deacetylase family protein n=1 Tax=Mesorhizobium sp. TaxID=1871066 RepID=UPI000FE9D90D|nr:PIG-L family deacetylase [Mesorhizobium sp.]RWL79802.1 MAG: LmbE-like protein [Mesorhizobium sp.]RWL82472.1 MAG: LmbE-like protein [Mesorhizobium sp.]RWL94176.1 MAG: LmbE-like protein [Mesorhizobium sp.]RWL95575.1 MAG: LmbE-like protein [Mesorhizobium sp.]TIP04721.1 MAG: LmbE-like protein [Mesorhizobium sp.]